MNLIIVLHVAATLAMTGLIWSVQAVQYPLFTAVGRREFATYHAAHMRRITWLVVPLMIVELATGIGLLWQSAWLGREAALIGLWLLAVAWGSTFLVQVPLHRQLSQSGDPRARHKLVATNWVRTGAWSARSVLVLSQLPVT